MRKTEVAMTILIASAAMLAAFFLTRALFGSEIEREATVETAEPIVKDESKGVSISRRIFNEKALNPTVEVYVNGDIDQSRPINIDDIESSVIEDTSDADSEQEDN